jgi:hypothetical protein
MATGFYDFAAVFSVCSSGYCDASLDNWCPTFRDNILVSPSRVEMYIGLSFQGGDIRES